MATLSGIPAWKIPRTEEPGRLHSPRGHKESDTTEHTHTAQPFKYHSLRDILHFIAVEYRNLKHQTHLTL